VGEVEGPCRILPDHCRGARNSTASQEIKPGDEFMFFPVPYQSLSSFACKGRVSA
jgi:hypothetical protein